MFCTIRSGMSPLGFICIYPQMKLFILFCHSQHTVSPYHELGLWTRCAGSAFPVAAQPAQKFLAVPVRPKPRPYLSVHTAQFDLKRQAQPKLPLAPVSAKVPVQVQAALDLSQSSSSVRRPEAVCLRLALSVDLQVDLRVAGLRVADLRINEVRFRGGGCCSCCDRSYCWQSF